VVARQFNPKILVGKTFSGCQAFSNRYPRRISQAFSNQYSWQKSVGAFQQIFLAKIIWQLPSVFLVNNACGNHIMVPSVFPTMILINNLLATTRSFSRQYSWAKSLND
jgi:hypothetical protein